MAPRSAETRRRTRSARAAGDGRRRQSRSAPLRDRKSRSTPGIAAEIPLVRQTIGVHHDQAVLGHIHFHFTHRPGIVSDNARARVERAPTFAVIDPGAIFPIPANVMRRAPGSMRATLAAAPRVGRSTVSSCRNVCSGPRSLLSPRRNVRTASRDAMAASLRARGRRPKGASLRRQKIVHRRHRHRRVGRPSCA